MKKWIQLCLGCCLLFALMSCGEPIEEEKLARLTVPVVAPNIYINLSHEQLLFSQQLDAVGEILSGELESDETTRQQLVSLGLEMPVVADVEMKLYVTLVHGDETRQYVHEFLTNQGKILINGFVFDEVGRFVFNIYQEVIGDLARGWEIDEQVHEFTVEVIKNEQTGRLIPTVVTENSFTFFNVVHTDVTEMLQAARQRLYADFWDNICEELDFSPLVSALEKHGEWVSIYFENFATGCRFMHREEVNYFAASVTKAPFSLWLYRMAEEHLINLGMYVEYLEEDTRPRSGIIRYLFEYGDYISVYDLIALNLYLSDNTATNMLLRVFGYHGYANFIEEMGGTRDYVLDMTNARLTAKEAGFFARIIHEYLESGGRYSEVFRQHLLANTQRIIVSDYPVASKNGGFPYLGGAWHDMAIVYAPSPFSLSILSADGRGYASDFEAFAYISMAFQQFNEINFIQRLEQWRVE